jgi:O-acetyl-ADP-ribose deacetylase (regulator of RNase III)
MQLQIKLGDIAKQADIQAVVNSANSNMRFGSGVAGAIHTAAGPELEAYCRQYAPLALGHALLTPGFNLPNQWVIHLRAAHYLNEENPERVLKDALNAMLKLVNENSIRSLALPAIGTGVFSFPPEVAARISAEALSRWVVGTPLELVRFCIPDRALAMVYQAELGKFF